MDPERFLRAVLTPGLRALAGLDGPAVTPDVQRFLLAVALQESDATHRYQHSPNEPPGPARGFWQFEAIAVQEMLTNSRTTILAKNLCLWYGLVQSRNAVYRAIEGHDGMAVGLARLLLLTHPDPVPDNEATGWGQYLSLWRPGRPRVERWAGCWQRAHEATLVAGGGDANAAPGTV